LRRELAEAGGTLIFTGITEPVWQFFNRLEFIELVGSENFFWSTDQALRNLAERD
jgi:hypothetical protein